MARNKTKFISAVAVLALLSNVSVALAQRRVICVSADNDRFTAGAEGYYRSRDPKPDPDVVVVGGPLANCLNQVRKGDQLIVIAHGGPGYFNWKEAKGPGDPTTYDGYGAGTGGEDPNPHPLPPNLVNTNNVTVTLVSCHSNQDPDGAGGQVSVVQSLRTAMGGANNTVNGYTNRVNSDYRWVVRGGTSVQQRQNAKANLEGNRAWEDNPPANRPGAATNQETVAAAQLAAKPQFAQKGLTITMTYRVPVEKAQAGEHFEVLGPFCEGANSIGSVEEEVPALAGWGAMALAFGLVVAAGIVLLRTRHGRDGLSRAG